MYAISRNQALQPQAGVAHWLHLLAPVASLLALFLLLPSAAAASPTRTARPQYANTHVFGAGDSSWRSALLQSGPSPTCAHSS